MGTQRDAIEAIRSGINVDISGGAGRGKSWVIDQIVDDKTVLMAPTGIAALNIGGETCHSCIGLPFGIPTQEDKNKTTRTSVELFGDGKVKRIVIDEKGMLRADHFDLIDHRLRVIKGKDVPFGGLQAVIVGDLWQLPSIVSAAERRFYRRLYKSPFVFDSNVYKEANFKHIELTKCYRQENVQQVELLDAIQTKGTGWKEAVAEINNICRAPHDDNTLNLCVFNNDALKVNKIHFDKNNNDVVSYRAEVEGKFNIKDCLVEPHIELKVGLRVILCANCPDKSYRNGQMGEVVDLFEEHVVVKLDSGVYVGVTPHKWEATKYKNGIKRLSRSVVGSCVQMPLRQGNAISIHKSQGLTLDNIVINMGRGAFGAALAYVALSRARDLSNIALTRPLREDDIITSRRVHKFFESLKQQ